MLNEILDQKGKGKATYYVPGTEFTGTGADVGDSEPVQKESEPVPDSLIEPLSEGRDNEYSDEVSKPAHRESEPLREELVNQLPEDLTKKLPNFTGRIGNKADLEDFICELCAVTDFSVGQLSTMEANSLLP